MKVKSIRTVLILLLIVGLLQIDAIGNLNPVFHSIAVSIRRMVNWVLDVQSPKSRRVILTSESEFLNADGSQDYPALRTEAPITPPSNTGGPRSEKPMKAEDEAWNLLEGDFGYIPEESTTDQSASKTLRLLQEVVEPEDPVTNLFPETEWYDEIDLEDYDWTDLLATEAEDEAVPLDHTLNADTVQPLVDEINAQIQQKVESSEFEGTPEK